MRKFTLFAAVAIVGFILLPSCLYTVDRTEFVYLTQFGKHVRTLDGARPEDAGLHFKWFWPIESVQRLDRRLQYFDLPGAEVMTRDHDRKTIDKTLTIDAYICWRIPAGEHVDQFVRKIGTVEGARNILSQRLGSELSVLVGEMAMNDLVSTDDDGDRKRVDIRREKLREDLMRQVRQSKEEYGIEVVDVRLRRTNHPATVRQAIFDRINSERLRLATEYESEGERLADNIKSNSKYRMDKMQARAAAAALAAKGEADRYVHSLLSKAQKEDPEFFAFLNMLDFYKTVFGDGKTQVMLSMSHKIFQAFKNPPAMAPK